MKFNHTRKLANIQTALTLICVGAMTLLGLHTLRAQSTPQKTSAKLTVVSVETSGYPTINGVTITNTADRDAAFKALVKAGYTNGMLMPQVKPTNSTQERILIETLTAAGKTGLLPPTPVNKGPGKFE